MQPPFSYTTNNGTITITGYWGLDGAATIPDTINGLPVNSIGTNAFLYSSLSSVTISNGVTGVGNDAYYDCTSLTNIAIPNSVTSIGSGAFSSCSSLAGVYFKGNAPSLGGSSVFSGDTNATVYYLPGTTGWGATFGTRLFRLAAMLAPGRRLMGRSPPSVPAGVRWEGRIRLWIGNHTMNLTNLVLTPIRPLLIRGRVASPRKISTGGYRPWGA